MSVEVLPADEHNQTLISHVHPPDWADPEPAGHYNLVVLGAGTAGLVSAAGGAGLGAKVAIVERELMGGDCLNVGCVPSKAMIRAARAAAEVRKAGEFGVRVPIGVTVDFPAVMERMRKLRAKLSPVDSAERFKGLGVDVFFGQARFTAEDAVEVNGKTLKFSRCVIATGARASKPNIPGLDEVPYLTNETVFSLTELPKRLAVIGAGPIGCELAQAFARFGSEVTVLRNGHGFLGKEDPTAAEIVRRSMADDGIRFDADGEVQRVERRGDETIVHLKRPDRTDELAVDQILVGVGRTPNVDGLDLEKAGVEYTDQGVTVDDTLRTSNKRIYAAGDICTKFKFTHAADAMARIVLKNALSPLGGGKVSKLVIPRCTYTDPEIAAVGLTEDEAKRQGIEYDIYEQKFDHVDRAVLDGEDGGYAKVLVKKGKDTILGATVVAAHAGEMISEVTVAMQAGLGLGKLADVIHPYPTQAEALKKIADAYNRTRLTPTLKWVLKKWLAWRR